MLRASLIAVLGLGILALAYGFLAPHAPPPPAPAGVESAEPAPRPGMPVSDSRPDGVAPPAADASVQPDIRDVTGPGITAGPRVTGSLVRVAPPVKPPAPEPPKPARLERLFRPVIPAAGIVASGDRQIRLQGIEAPAADAMCGEAVAAWPCGRMARAALRRFVRSRAVECEVPAGADSIPDPARCRVGGQDLSGWLVAQGWARRSGDDYAAVETAAREGGRGLWGSGRPGAQPDVAEASGGASSPDKALSISDLVSGMP